MLWLFSCAVGGWCAGSVAVRSPESRPIPSSGTVRSIGKTGHRFKKVISWVTLVPIFGGRYPVCDIQLVADRMASGLAIRRDAVIRTTLTHLLSAV